MQYPTIDEINNGCYVTKLVNLYLAITGYFYPPEHSNECNFFSVEIIIAKIFVTLSVYDFFIK